VNWDFFTPLLDTSFEHLRGNRERIFAFGKEMRCLTLFGEKRIGTKFVEYLLNARYFHKPDWRSAALDVCAGMLLGWRDELLNLLSQHGIDDVTFREIESKLTQEVLDQERTFGARARWNLFFVRVFAFNSRFRYLVTKYMLGPIALCNSVPEWAHQMGTFLIEAIRAYSVADDVNERYGHLSVEKRTCDAERSFKN
jgi:hypothetical protein